MSDAPSFAHRYWSTLTGQRTPPVRQAPAVSPFWQRYWASFTMTGRPSRRQTPDRPRPLRTRESSFAGGWDLLDSGLSPRQLRCAGLGRFPVLAPLAAALAIIAIAIGLRAGLSPAPPAPFYRLKIPAVAGVNGGRAFDDTAFSPTSLTVAAGLARGRVEVWNAATGHSVLSRELRVGGWANLAFSPDGKILAVGNCAGAIELLNATTLSLLGVVHGSSCVREVAFGPGGRTLAAAQTDGRVSLWNIAEPAHPGRPSVITVGDPVRRVAFSPDGTTLAAADADGSIWLWNVARPADPRPLWSVRIGGSVNSVAFSPDGATVAEGGSGSGIGLWRVSTGTMVGYRLIGDGGTVNKIAFNPNGGALAAGDSAGRIDLWDGAGRLIARYRSGWSSVCGVAFTQGGATLMAATGGRLLVFHRPPG